MELFHDIDVLLLFVEVANDIGVLLDVFFVVLVEFSKSHCRFRDLNLTK